MFKSIYKISLFLIFFYFLSTHVLRAEIVEKINVEGNQRISSDTIKISKDKKKITKTLDRDEIWFAQTPQSFKVSILKKSKRLN